jgi:HEPN domain-containing protein
MAVSLQNKTIIPATDLLDVGVHRLAEAKILLRESQFAGAVYLAGYGVECYLKAVICKTLDLAGLPRVFMTHDLDILLFHSGLHNRLQSDNAMADRFKRIVGQWNVERREEKQGNKTILRESIRYRRPRDFSKSTAEEFLSDAMEIVA